MEKFLMPFLRAYCRVSYDPKKGLVQSEEGIQVTIASDQSGLRKIYRGWDEDLDCLDNHLLGWVGSGKRRSEPKGSRRKFR